MKARRLKVRVLARAVPLSVRLSRIYERIGGPWPGCPMWHSPIPRWEGSAEKTHAPIERAVSFIHANFRQPLTLQEIAEHAGYSVFYFSRMFRRLIGTSPIDYLNRVRVEAVKRRLAAGDEQVKCIAYEEGFRDLRHFRRVFRRIVGVIPTQYRVKHWGKW